MQRLNREQQQLVTLLRAIYDEILPLEQALDLRVSQKDQRPRIDYFYDALRALTDDLMPMDLRLERLSLSWLAYDATALRYLESKPLAALNPHQTHQSPNMQLRTDTTGALSTTRTANREDKRLLSSLYLRFGVMFVALFKPFADRDFRDQSEDMELQIQEITDVHSAIEAIGQGSMTPKQLEEAATHCPDPEIKKLVASLLESKGYRKPETLSAALNATRARQAQKKNALVMLEMSHMNFAASQLALYETGRDVVKNLATQGLNVAGEHLNQAMTQTNQHSRGR